MSNVLRDYRVAAKMTRKELSVLSGVPERTIRAYETDTRDFSTAAFSTVYSLGCQLTEFDDDLVVFFDEVIKNGNSAL